MAPRKVRVVANVIRGKRVPEAERALKFLTRRAALPIEKLLASAVVNARHNFQVADPGSLVISEISVSGGPTLKRRRPRAMGRAFPIKKRTAHVRLILETTAASGAAPRRSAPMVSEARRVEPSFPAPASKPSAEREVLRRKPRIMTKPTDFVRRMFRRKAI